MGSSTWHDPIRFNMGKKMKISLIKPNSVNVDPWVPEFRSLGINVLVNNIDSDCDFIICASHSQVGLLKNAHYRYPKTPIINYNWDLYGWIWKNPGTYDWRSYGEMLFKSTEIWCPSNEVIKRTEEFFKLGYKCKVIKTFARFFNYDGDITDNRYVLNPMRPYIFDKNYGWLKKACQELDIPLKESNHSLTEKEFQKTIAQCSFLCTEYHEASTGGLTLLEGYRLSKPVIVSDSEYMGARDYFGDRAIYFDDNNYHNFKFTLNKVWNNTPVLNIEECRAFTDTIPSVKEMVMQMANRLWEIKNK